MALPGQTLQPSATANSAVGSEDIRKKLLKVEDAVSQLKASLNGDKSMVEQQLNVASTKYDKALDDLKLQMELP